MKQLTKFLRALLQGAGASLELLIAFALGLFVVGLLSDVTHDLLIAPAESLPVVWRPLLAAAVLTAAAYGLYRWDLKRRQNVGLKFDESRLAPPHRGLIWLFGPGTFDHLLFALKHHADGGGGEHCWLVMQDIDPVREAFARLSEHLVQEKEISTQLHPVYIQSLEVDASYKAVRSVFDREAAEEGLAPEDVIADVTGGTKPLATGLVLATLTAGGALEYVESDRDADGWPIPSTLRVVLVDITFYFKREE